MSGLTGARDDETSLRLAKTSSLLRNTCGTSKVWGASHFVLLVLLVLIEAVRLTEHFTLLSLCYFLQTSMSPGVVGVLRPGRQAPTYGDRVGDRVGTSCAHQHGGGGHRTRERA